ncbi:MAG TPA: glycosyltransferase family 4 protein [Acidimicrobiales bacterium]|jgi:glycosyltransferase involved in cell wall biosynthesis|nr:glycosyltransferase family 4 protein [Acidimicrobiales bacterium]
MKVAFVVPRYGPTVVGGAETAARLLAEHLVSQMRWEVEVLTSCAEDFVTWEDVFEAGEEAINGVAVTRFASSTGRDPSFHPFSASLLAEPSRVSMADAERWVDLQGPVLPALTEACARSDADAVVFYPYLYYPTVRAIGRVRAPTILHPAAHDEPALHLPVFPTVFETADGLVFQTVAERELVQRTFPVASHRQLLLGLGVDDPDRMPIQTAGVKPPFLLGLGRVDRHKGTPWLVSLFAAYKQRHPGPLRLVLAGPVVEPVPHHSDIDVLGAVPEPEKWALLQEAAALVSPSPYEAFSLAVAEAWSARTPVLVNRACRATVEHCRRSGGGLPFAGFADFEAIVDRLTGDPAAARRLGARGRAYVDRWFRWPRVVDRYAGFVERVAAA